MDNKDYFAQVQGFSSCGVGSDSANGDSPQAGRDRASRETAYRLQRQDCYRGVGKSGIIAQKIAATMTSTGTGALHLHPSDALHGGIGIINSDDVVMILSNSGETHEIIEMLPYLKHRQVPFIALVGNINSTLAQRADAVIDASVDQEACPLNLAPTTSTTVALAVGDALALTLMQVKGLTLDDFAINHPGGQLGKRLTLTVADLMHSGADNPTISSGALWLEVVKGISAVVWGS
jgi:arabinose-5-phosphate isomerase